MRTIISTSENIGVVRCVEGRLEVCVIGEAVFDEAAPQLVMTLSSYLRSTGLRASDARVTKDWLPADQTVRESLEFDEALSVARDIFKSWAAKVRRCIPQTELQTV